MDIKSTLQEFERRKSAINTNVDLSQEGRRKQLAALEAEAANTRAGVIRDLQTRWAGWKASARANMEAVKKAEAEAAREWDYSRLGYMAQALKGAITRAGTIENVMKEYQRVKDSGDNHARRAWAENAGEIVRAHFRGGEVEIFVKDLAKDAAEVIATPELKALRAEGAKLTEKARELDEQTQHARAFYSPGAGGVFALGDEFTAMREGVKITQRVNKDLATETIVSLD